MRNIHKAPVAIDIRQAELTAVFLPGHCFRCPKVPSPCQVGQRKKYREDDCRNNQSRGFNRRITGACLFDECLARLPGQCEIEHYSANYTGRDRRNQDAHLGLINNCIRGKRQFTNEYRHGETDACQAACADYLE